MNDPHDMFMEHQKIMLSEYFTALGTEISGQKLTEQYACAMMIDVNILLSQFIEWARDE